MQDYFFVRRDKHYEQVNFQDILYIKAKLNYIQIVTEQKTILVMNSLTMISKHLPKELFCRIHNSFIVSLWHVMAFDRNFVYLYEMPGAVGLAKAKKLSIGHRHRFELPASITIMMNKSGTHVKKNQEPYELKA